MDEVDVGELTRNLAALTVAVEKMGNKLDNLPKELTPREVHDLALGGVKVDIRRLDEQHTKEAVQIRKTAEDLDKRLDEIEKQNTARFRHMVYVVVAGVICPLTVYVLTNLPGGSP